MTYQRKNRILSLFKKKYSLLVEKVREYQEIENVRIITIHQNLGNYNCFIYYDRKKEKFTKIFVIEEIIEIRQNIEL